MIMYIFGIFCLVLFLCYAFLWLASIQKYDVRYGISFSIKYAEALGLDWRETYEAMLKDLRPAYVRVAAQWDLVEKNEGTFDFSDIDWQMDKAREYGAQVVLVVGQKAPRWPECHVPDWIKSTEGQYDKKLLLRYVTAVVNQYKNHEALELWQVENEAFIRFKFGECGSFVQEYIYDEIELVRSLDSAHKIVLTDSGELSTWRRPIANGDYFGTTLYRVVATPGGRFVTYDWLPAAFYKLKARIWGLPYERMFVSELQAEPWFPDGDPHTTPIAFQEKSMSIARLQKNFEYAQRVGASRVYLWGVEWWYWMKQVQNDDRYWRVVQEKLSTDKKLD